jgi:hypothetical protein
MTIWIDADERRVQALAELLADARCDVQQAVLVTALWREVQSIVDRIYDEAREDVGEVKRELARLADAAAADRTDATKWRAHVAHPMSV